MKVHVMLENLILLVIYGIEVVNYSIGLRLVLKERRQNVWYYIFGALAAIIYVCIFAANANYLVIYAIVILCTCLSIKDKIRAKIIELLVLVILIGSIEETISGVTRTMIMQTNVLSNIKFLHSFLDSCWGTMVLLYLYFRYYNKSDKPDMKITKNRINLIIVLNGILIVLVISTLNFAKDFVVDSFFQIFAAFLVSVAYICMSLLCYLLIFLRMSNEKTKNLLLMEKKLNVARGEYFKKMLEKEEETRKFRHDINNHLLYMKSLVDKNDLDTLKIYLGGVNHKLSKIQKSLFKTGNNLLDVILNEKVLDVKDKVRIVVNSKVTKIINIDEIDLCTIFANLLDNAVEEVKERSQNDPYITISLRTGNAYFKMRICNSITKKIKFERNGLPKSTKEDLKNHGIGLNNVRRTIEKYNGEFNISADEKEFSAEVVLPLSDKSTVNGVK